MLKNKKGFTLSELMAVVITIGVLSAFAVPTYRTSMIKTRIVNNMAYLNALQNDMLNYYNLHGRLPNKLTQLSITAQDFRNLTDTTGTHIPTGCTLTLNNNENAPNIFMNCNQDWSMEYQLNSTGIGYTLGNKVFIVGQGSNTSRLDNIASSLGWTLHGNHTYTIR